MGHVIVLGAGGRPGWVWHLGVARALQRAGLDAGDADLVIGTSAGSAIGAMLSVRHDIDDAIHLIKDPPTPDERRAFVATMRAQNRGRKWLPMAPGLLRRAARREISWNAAFAGLLPPGWFPTDMMTARLGIDAITAWPPALRIPALSLATGKLVVFGPATPSVSVADAVQASSSIPGLFRPKAIGGSYYVDGAVVSSTNADLALEVEARTVIVSAPLARPGWRSGPRRARRRLRREAEVLRNAGREVTVVVPDASTRSAWRAVSRQDPAGVLDLVAAADEMTAAALRRRRSA